MHNYHKIQAPFKRTTAKDVLIDENVYSDCYISMLSNITWLGTEKIDGMNLNLCYDGNHLSVKGHTDKTMFSQEQIDWFDRFLTPELEQMFEQYYGEEEVIFHGEFVGPKIQGNLYNLDDYKFIVFDIYSVTKDVYYSQPVVKCIAENFGLEVAPLVVVGTLQRIIEYVKSAPSSMLNPKQEMEGVVIRPEHELKNFSGHRIIYKVKLRDLLGRDAKCIE
jgi:ATP-dependent RNA circularization protein (DNA/RNA ligase family)